MYHKVRITKLPGKARGGKVNGNRIVPNQALSFGGADLHAGPKDISVANTISAVPRDQANLEAEGGETVYGDINGDGMAEHLVIKGPRHSSGGVPLNLPDDTFIFSDTKSMKITDCKILSMFNKPCNKGGFTPATLAKQYDLSKYRKMLQDPESGDLERKTAEIMIRNYTMKLGALALAQESKKGFPQGIPEVARPYMEANGINDEDLIPEIAQQQQMQSPQEEGMEQGPGMQNPQEEMMEMPQEDMMAMQQPMAQYGMQFGGYDMPFYPTSDMSYMAGDEDYMDIPMYPTGGTPPANAEVVKDMAADPYGVAAQNYAYKKSLLAIADANKKDQIDYEEGVKSGKYIGRDKEGKPILNPSLFQRVTKTGKNKSGGATDKIGDILSENVAHKFTMRSFS